MAQNTSDGNFQTDPGVYPIRKHTLPQTILLHLLPGGLITAFFFLIAPSLIQRGFPPILSLYLAILLILIPFELGFLFYQGKKRNGHYSLNGIVLFRERMPIGKMILIIISLFAWGGLIFTLLPKLDSLISETLFAWFPAWSSPNNLLGNISQYSKSAITITIIAGFLLNGFAGPIVEEFYFRGYLLPRIPATKWWSPLINVLLFSLYHFFTPWQNLSRILAFLPLSYAVAWKRNIFLSIWAHCLLNTAGMIISFML
ncbi:MAG: CPBP family intramembrane metalloprotease [Anaerolineaceae bacterium]|nr:CPBP family intramembrane metalloprotease [Anaerolineaceae bacterium]